MCKDLCTTVAKINTPQGEVEVIAVARGLSGSFHSGYLTLAIPGQDIRAEFFEILSRDTWEKAWSRLIRQIEHPRFRNNPLFREPAMLELLQQAQQGLALLPCV